MTIVVVFGYHAEDIETSLSDYQKALSILEKLVEPDSRQIAELYPTLINVLSMKGFFHSVHSNNFPNLLCELFLNLECHLSTIKPFSAIS